MYSHAVQALFDRLFTRFIAIGVLVVIWPDGTQTRYQGRPGPACTVHFTTRDALRRLLMHASLAMGELYMEGSFVPTGCSIYQVMDVITANLAGNRVAFPGLNLDATIRRLHRSLSQYNPGPRARRNVAHHYDLSEQLYAMFLDADRQYSCAYFATGSETLEEAQAAKKRHIAKKLLLDRPDLTVLDIGCGWGGMALTLAREYGAKVTGITLSTEQLAIAQARAQAEGLSDRVSFRLQDYREVPEVYDRIVSVGMFEHVGVTYYDTYFATLHRALAPDGVALLHTIGLTDGPHATNPWMTKYIFPGGYSPSMSEVLSPIERSGLLVTDIEILRLHYATTISHWRARFAARRSEIAALYDERFCRMFEFYLVVSELGFRRLDYVVFQFQLAHRQDAVPLTRDYMG